MDATVKVMMGCVGGEMFSDLVSVSSGQNTWVNFSRDMGDCRKISIFVEEVVEEVSKDNNFIEMFIVEVTKANLVINSRFIQ